MAPSAGSEQMATVRAGGLALLPWTRQVLAVLWGHVRLLLQLIYYSFVSGKKQTPTEVPLCYFTLIG